MASKEAVKESVLVNSVSPSDEIEDLTAVLCVNAPTEDVKKFLRCYQYGKSITQMKRDINGSGNKMAMIETANIPNIPDVSNENKSEIIHMIIRRIQNLLPDDCYICKF